MSKRPTRIYSAVYAFLSLTFILSLVGPVAVAQNLPPDETNSIYDDTVWYKAGTGTGAGSGCSGNLTGSDNEQKTWNYFKSKGLSDAQTAGIMGNMQQESSFNPLVLQIGGESQNPYDALGQGWGIVQWTGDNQTYAGDRTTGDKVTAIYKETGVSGPVYQLATELDMVYAEMQGTSPTGVQDMLTGLKQITDAAQAATYFDKNFEGGSDPGGVRESNAVTILQQYGGSGGSGGAGGCIIGSGTDCTTVTGDPKILCEAEKYQGIYYRWGGGHQGYAAFIAGCPDPSNPPNNYPTGSPPDPTDGGLSGNPSPCATDCTGLVSIAVDEAFNLNYMWTVAGSMQGDGAQYWKQIPIAQATAGDIVTTPDHVEIVMKINGDTVYTFGSHETGTLTGPATSTISNWTGGAWRWTGPGSKG